MESIIRLGVNLFDLGMRSRVTTLIIYVGIGMVLEPVGLLLLRAFNFTLKTAEWKTYYFVIVLCALIRGNGLYLFSKLISRKGIRLSKLPKEIASVLVMVFVFSILNCCFVVLISMEAGNGKSMVIVHKHYNFNRADVLLYALHDGTI